MKIKVFLIDASICTAADAVNFMQREAPYAQFDVSCHSSVTGSNTEQDERVLICVAYHLLAPAAATALHQVLAQHPNAKLVVIRDAAELPSIGCLLDAMTSSPAAAMPCRKPAAARPASSPALPRLSERESEILSLLQQGLQNKLIARRLGLSVSTVKTHVANIFRKVGAETRLDAICKVAALGGPAMTYQALPFRPAMAAGILATGMMAAAS